MWLLLSFWRTQNYLLSRLYVSSGETARGILNEIPLFTDTYPIFNHLRLDLSLILWYFNLRYLLSGYLKITRARKTGANCCRVRSYTRFGYVTRLLVTAKLKIWFSNGEETNVHVRRHISLRSTWNFNLSFHLHGHDLSNDTIESGCDQ